MKTRVWKASREAVSMAGAQVQWLHKYGNKEKTDGRNSRRISRKSFLEKREKVAET